MKCNSEGWQRERFFAFKHFSTYLASCIFSRTVMSFEYMVWLHCQVPHSDTGAFHLALFPFPEVAHTNSPQMLEGHEQSNNKQIQ